MARKRRLNKKIGLAPHPTEISKKMESTYNKIRSVVKIATPFSYHKMRELSHVAKMEPELTLVNGKIDPSKAWMVKTLDHSRGRSVGQTCDNIQLLERRKPKDAEILRKMDKALDQLPKVLKDRGMFIADISTSLHHGSAQWVEFMAPTDFPRLTQFMVHQFSKWKHTPEEERRIKKGEAGPMGRIMFIPDFGRTKGEDMDSPNIEKNKQIFFDPKTRVTFILGSTYGGEGKKSNMRLAQFIHTHVLKKGLGIHAGAFDAVSTDKKGIEQDRKGVLVLGLSGTGKSTTSMMKFDKFENHFKQDDMLLLNWDGSAHGMENGMYVKTDWDNNDPKKNPIQGTVIESAMRPSAMIENVNVKNGKPDFVGSKEEYPNGRALVARDDFHFASRDPNLKKVDVMFFNVRGPFPLLQKLKNADHAATFFALGETIKRKGTVVEEQSHIIKKLEAKEHSLEKIVDKNGLSKNAFMNMLNALYTVEPRMRPKFAHFKKVQKILKEAKINFDEVMEHKPWREEPVREMGFDPFTPSGFKNERIAAFRKFLKKNPHVQVYLMNTGSVGAENIKIKDTRAVMEAVITGKMDDKKMWVEGTHTGTLIPKTIPGVKKYSTRFDPHKQFGKEVYQSILTNLKADRVDYLKRYSKLQFLTLDGKKGSFSKELKIRKAKK
ncbi:phosphoenolpyruvate carboxykinase (ATP) [archaeon]|nr:phosphoenolpyruvate carboxykinase (ATP) [archaeon]